jgi:hypothetical protein
MQEANSVLRINPSIPILLCAKENGSQELSFFRAQLETMTEESLTILSRTHVNCTRLDIKVPLHLETSRCYEVCVHAGACGTGVNSTSSCPGFRFKFSAAVQGYHVYREWPREAPISLAPS